MTASGEIAPAPGEGKRIQLKYAYYVLTGDEVAYLRFGDSGKRIFPTKIKGAFGGNLLGANIKGGDNQALNAYKNAGNSMVGFVIYEVVNA